MLNFFFPLEGFAPDFPTNAPTMAPSTSRRRFLQANQTCAQPVNQTFVFEVSTNGLSITEITDILTQANDTLFGNYSSEGNI